MPYCCCSRPSCCVLLRAAAIATPTAAAAASGCVMYLIFLHVVGLLLTFAPHPPAAACSIQLELYVLFLLLLWCADVVMYTCAFCCVFLASAGVHCTLLVCTFVIGRTQRSPAVVFVLLS